jgi:hypothetical protein
MLENTFLGRRISLALSSSDEEDSIGTTFDLEVVEDRRPGICGEDPVKLWKRVDCLSLLELDLNFLGDIANKLKVVQVKGCPLSELGTLFKQVALYSLRVRKD